MKKITLSLLIFTLALFNAVAQPSVKTLSTDTLLLVKNGNTYMLGQTELDRKAYRQFLKLNSEHAYRQYTTGNGMLLSGWFFLGGGVAMFAAGLPCYLTQKDNIHLPYSDTFSRHYAIYSLGRGLMAVGGIITFVSVPLLTIGSSMKSNAYKTYNQERLNASQNTTLSLNLNAGSNGIALALRF